MHLKANDVHYRAQSDKLDIFTYNSHETSKQCDGCKVASLILIYFEFGLAPLKYSLNSVVDEELQIYGMKIV